MTATGWTIRIPRRAPSFFLAATILATLAATSPAATLRVARDGSGDFLTLQEALDVAASGDVISMAPGVYDQVFTRSSGVASFQIHGWVSQAHLTIVGDDKNMVIVGPENAPANIQTAPPGVATALGVSLSVRDITFRNVSEGIHTDGSQLSVADCNFLGNYHGIDSAAQFGTDVVDCVFEGSTAEAILLSIALGGSGAVISRCHFLNTKQAIDSQMAGTFISDCSVTGGLNGIQSSFGGVSTLTNCHITGQSNLSLDVSQGSTLHLFNNVVENTSVCLSASGSVSGSGNLFAGGSAATIVTSRAAFYDFHENHILNGGGWTIWGQIGGTLSVVTHDFSNNFWGTSDANQIRAWIFDNTDDSRIRWIADFEPFHMQPVSTEAISFGELRALFGGE